MADKLDEAEYNRLQGEKNTNRNKQEDCKATIDSLNGKIDDLKAAYDKLDEAKETLEDTLSDLKHIPSNQFSGWKGAVADEIKNTCKEKDGLYGQYDTYIKKIDDIEDAINWQIHNLKSQINDQEGILGDLKDSFDWISTKIRNFFN